jgi:hypothetical protein
MSKQQANEAIIAAHVSVELRQRVAAVARANGRSTASELRLTLEQKYQASPARQ